MKSFKDQYWDKLYLNNIPIPLNSQLAIFVEDTSILSQDNCLELANQNLQSLLN